MVRVSYKHGSTFITILTARLKKCCSLCPGHEWVLINSSQLEISAHNTKKATLEKIVKYVEEIGYKHYLIEVTEDG